MNRNVQPDTRPTVDQLVDRSLVDITNFIEDGWEYRHSLGGGAYSDLFKGKYVLRDPSTGNKASFSVAIKVIRGRPGDRPKTEQRINREILAQWRVLKHPNVAEFLGIVSRRSGPPGLVSRWVQRNNFSAYMARHRDLKRPKAQEIVRGLAYLHRQGVIHGDLKMDNILVADQGHAQITDFGISWLIDVKGYTTVTQRNVRYAAPELMPREENVGIAIEGEIQEPVVRPTYASDIYSLAILLLQLFDGHDPSTQRGMPYNHITYRDAYDIGLATRVNRGEMGERPQRHLYEPMFDQHWNILQACWHWDPSSRPGAEEVLRRL